MYAVVKGVIYLTHSPLLLSKLHFPPRTCFLKTSSSKLISPKSTTCLILAILSTMIGQATQQKLITSQITLSPRQVPTITSWNFAAIDEDHAPQDGNVLRPAKAPPRGFNRGGSDLRVGGGVLHLLHGLRGQFVDEVVQGLELRRCRDLAAENCLRRGVRAVDLHGTAFRTLLQERAASSAWGS